MHYTEVRGDQAEDDLRSFLNALPSQPGFLGAELLVSPAQPGLALVASRWSGQAPPLPLLAGARAWVFEVLEAR